MEIKLSQPYSFIQLGKRDNQEDARFPDCDAPVDTLPFFVVCDGVGGQDKGEVASSTVASTIGHSITRPETVKRFGEKEFISVLEKVYSELNRKAKVGKKDMATTMTFLCFCKDGAFIAYIGDSRIYQVRPQAGILFKSDDHSLVNALARTGNITPDEVDGHPRGNVITRCLRPTIDNEPSPVATLLITDIEKDDYFFLCSDGVTHKISDQMLFDMLSNSISDHDKIKRMADICRDSSDNNTAYLIHIKDVSKEDSASESNMEEESKPTQNTVDTKRIEVPVNSIKDVNIPKNKSLTGKVSEFFNKLF